MLARSLFAVLFLAIFLTSNLSAAIVDEALCGTEDPLTTYLADIDTVRVVTLFTAGSFGQDIPGMEEMKQWMYDIWNENYQTSLPHFYQTTSFSKFRMTGDSYPEGDTAFLTDLPWGSFWDFNQHHTYMNDILPHADSVIDFGLYDNRGQQGSSTPDGIVDYFVFVTLTAAAGGGCAFDGVTYTTNDTNSLGDTVQIRASNTTWMQIFNDDIMLEWCPNGDSCLHVSGKFKFVAYFIHETNHHLGIGHHFPTFSFGSENGFRLYANAVSSPHEPYWQEKKTWSDPRSLSEPLYSVEIPDRNTADSSVFKLTSSVSGFQGFQVSGHKRAVEEEDEWPVPNDLGTMVWHFNDHGGSSNLRKKADIEVPMGLFNWDIEDCTGPGEIPIDNCECNIEDTNCTVTYQMLTAQPNTVNGYDSLDWRDAWPRTRPYPAEAEGSKLCIWDGINYRHFDGTTNPSSDFHASAYSNNQNTPSHIGVRNISIDTINAKIYADLLVNNWYDTLDGNTTWGNPSQYMGYAITGDVVVEASDTLTIEEGTTIYFQDTEDNQAGGADNGRCELIVYGTLIAEGTSSDSILFIPSSEQLGSASPRDWYGIRLMPGSKAVMEYCGIRYAEFGVYMDSSSQATISSCLLSQNDNCGILVDEASLDLDSSAVTYNDHGVLITHDGLARIDDCEFSDNVGEGVWNVEATLVMRGCTVENNGIYGIRGRESIDSVYTTAISGEKYGLYLEGDEETIIDSCVITSTGSSGSYYGIYARKYMSSEPVVYVRNDSIAGFPQGGIYFKETSEDGIITNTDVVSCETYGIYYYDSSVPISGGEDNKNLI
jgi:parallel beta-helix repeat protein